MRAFLGYCRVVDHQHGIAAADQPIRLNKQFRLHRPRIPDPGRNEVVQLIVFAKPKPLRHRLNALTSARTDQPRHVEWTHLSPRLVTQPIQKRLEKASKLFFPIRRPSNHGRPLQSRPPMSHRKTDLGIPCRSKSAKVVLARVDKIEDELRVQAFERAQAEFERKYLFRRRAESNEKLSAETKGFRAEADPKLPVEAPTIPAVTATEPAPLLPPATDADYADAFAENMHIYSCADQIQNSARKRYDAVRDQIDLRRAAELASKMVNGEVAPTERQLQSGEASSVEHLRESASASTSTSVLLPSIQPFTTDASGAETLMSVRSTQLLAPPNSLEPHGSAEVSTASAGDAAPAIEQLSIAVGETSRSASSPQFLEVPNSPETQESSEVSTA